MTTAADQSSRSAAASRAWHGVPVLSQGFRPFFPAAGAWALIGMALWLPVFTGAITIPTAFSAVDWHAHEMIFGYAGAVVAGFLLTAIPNWTGRLPVAGWPLAAPLPSGPRAGSSSSHPHGSAVPRPPSLTQQRRSLSKFGSFHLGILWRRRP